MVKVTRRFFLLSSAALPIGCAMRGRDVATPTGSKAAVRPPATGQAWRYAKHDLFTGRIVDTQIDSVTTVGHTVDIDSRSEGTTAMSSGKSAWGMDWLRKYTGEHDRPPSSLPSEIQDPWGMVVVDPHWGEVQAYESPIPLWPTQLHPGWEKRIVTKYKTPDDNVGLRWDQIMKATGWETVTVPAGSFTALKFINMIQFASTHGSRRDSTRKETVWFAPEIGRWVIRESSGNYYLDESVDDTQAAESGYRWELLTWT